ncbi:hypothetical protein [uncultured Bradyrhizobium sp.]|uniref:hypothetical protein n=1 Tax=uncultured Bradyrhizobium sp. TaxID=199684 RepID=UPI00263073DC|nr:hypothetical protein [uncultured Bradyrhizobium sp.]
MSDVPEAQGQQLLDRQCDEWPAGDFSLGLRLVADECAEPAIEIAGDDERFTNFDFTFGCKATSSLRSCET